MSGNAAIVRRGYEAFDRGDLNAPTELFGTTSPGALPAAARSPATSSGGRPSSPVSAAT